MRTLEEIQAELLQLAEALEPCPPPPPPPGPSFNTRTVTIYVHDVLVPNGTMVARVPLVLSEPAHQTLLCRILTQNGTAREGAHFQRVDKWISFEPGETAKIIDIPLNAAITGLTFKLNASHPQGWDGTAAPDFVDSSASIYGEGSQAVTTPKVEAVTITPTPKPSGLQLVWEEQFDPLYFNATDTGFLTDGVTPCWRTCMGNGDRFWNNGTVGLANDPVLHPGTQPWGWDANGTFFMQSERPATPLLHTKDGQTTSWEYTMPFLTTQRLPIAGAVGVGDYIEGRMTMPFVQGAWAAFWFLTNRPNAWPRLEFDAFETFYAGGPALGKVGTTVHWEEPPGSNDHKQYGIKIPHTGIDPTTAHTWGMWWGEKQIVFYVDDKAFFSVPNIWEPDDKAYIKLDIAVGGAGGTPDPLNWPVKMPIEWIKIWR